MKNVPLGDIATLVRGVSFSKEEGGLLPLDGHLPIIRAGSIQESLLLREGQIWVPADKIKSSQKIRIDDIVMCTSSGSSDLVGKCARSTEDFDGSFGAFCAGIRADQEKASPSYLYHFLRSPVFKNWTSTSSGANIKNIRVSELAEFQIPLPPLPEQKRIAVILDKADAIRRKRHQAIQLADDFIRAVFLDMFGDPVTNPKGWEVRPLIELIDPDRPITYGILMPGDDIEGGVPYVRVVDMKDGVVLVGQVRRTTLEIAQQYKRSSLRAGDVLMSIRGHVGRLAVVPKELEGANITQDTARLATNSHCSSLYLYACLENRKMQQEMQRFVKGAAVKGINLTDVKQLRIPVPPIELQKKIERKIELMTAALTSLEQSSVCLLDGFKSLSQKAFSGQLSIRKSPCA